MTSPNSDTVQNSIFHGTFRIFLSEALLLPTGLITAAYLTRKFGPSDYGLFTLAATIISWVEWTVSSIFARATLKFASETEDWQPLGTKVIQLHLIGGCLAAAAIWIFSDLIAAWLGDPLLSACLKWFAIDIPLFSMAQAYRNLLIGMGRFNARAVISMARWLVRLFAIIGLVELGLSLQGAIFGSIAASVAEFLVARIYVNPSLFHRSDFPASKLWDYAIPLFLFALSMRIYEKLDLVMLMRLGGNTAEAGFYGAAQNLSLVVSLFSLSFSPLLLSSLSRMLHRSEEEQARTLGLNSLRVVFALFPFAAMTAGASTEIVKIIFGSTFLDTAPALARLIFSGVLLAGISVITAILTAIGRPGLTFALTGPMLPLSIAGYIFLIPRDGIVGAATVNLAVASLGFAVLLMVLKRLWGICPSLYSMIRAVLLSVLSYEAAVWWPARGWVIPLKLLILSMMIGIGFLMSGEISLSGLNFLRSKQSPMK